MYRNNTLSANELKLKIQELLSRERQIQGEFLKLLSEIDRRRLWADWAFSSCFDYLTIGLKLSNGAAHRRISVARLGRSYPVIFGFISDGKLTMSGASIISKGIKDQNLSGKKAQEMIEKAVGLNEDEIKHLFRQPVKRLKLESAKPLSLFLPVDQAPGHKNSRNSTDKPSRNPTSKGSARQNHKEQKSVKVEMVEVKITMTQEEFELLKRMRDLQHTTKAPMTKAVVKATKLWLSKNDPMQRQESRKMDHKKMRSTSVSGSGSESSSPKTSRYRPKAVETQVWKRDLSRCTFVSTCGRRCQETRSLEVDHVIPFSKGGRSDDPANLRLRCKTHNLHAAEQHFGTEFMAQFRLESP